MNRRITKLTLAGIGLFLVLGGPTPGSIGDCSEGENYADPVAHCQQKQAWTCARRAARGDIDETGQAECITEVSNLCSGATWPSGCQPTQQESDACIAAMMDGSTLGTPGQCLPDCGTAGPMCGQCDQPPQCDLCGATGALTSDGGLGE